MVLGAVGLSLALAACAAPGTTSSSAAGPGKLYSVKAVRAPFYRYGPQQANGPDQRLPRNTVLTVVSVSFGYSKVQLESGEQGYVASEDIQQAPPDIAGSLAKTPSIVAQSHSRKNRLDFHDALLPAAPLPLDLPEPTPIPGPESSPVAH